MKRAILAVAALAALCGCNKEELARQQHTIDSLKTVVAMRDSANNDISQTLSEIRDNLNYIKDQEGIVSVGDAEGERKNAYNNDIDAIYAKLLDNKKKISRLQSRLNTELGKNKQYDELIAQLQEQTERQLSQIEALNSTVDSKNAKIGTLEAAINNLSQSIDSLTKVNQDILANLDETTNKLNTRYYLVATKSFLKEKGLLQTGLFKGKKLVGDGVDSRFFTKIDKRKTNTIALKGKKVEVLTTHPASSYSIDDNYRTLTITDSEAFWASSNCLIVCTK